MHRSFRNLPIRRKLTLITMLTTGVALVLACVILLVYEQITARIELVEEMTSTAAMLGDNSAAALSFNDPSSAEQTLQSLQAHEDVVGAIIYQKDGSVFATYSNGAVEDALDSSKLPAEPDGHRFGNNSLELFRGIDLADERIGVVYIHADLREMQERLLRSSGLILVVLVVASLIAYLLSEWLLAPVSGPILQLAGIVHEVAARKDYSVRAVKQNDDELGQLIDGFNEMLNQIQARDSSLEHARDNLEEDVTRRTSELQQAYARLEMELTQREAMQTSLRESEERFRLSFESSAIGMAIVALDGRWLKANPAICRMVGYSEAEMQATDFQSLTHPDDLEEDVALTRKLIARELASYQMEKRYFHKDGRVVWVRLSVALARSAAGVALHFISQIEDIAERKRAEQAVADSETRLLALIGNSSDIIAITALDGRLTYISPSVKKIAGYEPDELIGRVFMERVHPDDQAAAVLQFKELLAHPGSTYRIERRYLHKDGSWIESDSIAVNLMHVPAIAGVVSTMRDITERKQAERALKSSEERFSSAFEHASIGMALQALDGRYLKVNQALCELLGYGEEELLQMTYQNVTHPDHLAADALNVQELLSDKIPSHQTEKRYVHKQGHAVWAQISDSLVRDAQGQPLYFITTVLDIRQRKRAEAELEQSHKQLMDASRRAGMAEVATNVLHNVGNVLNSINVSASLVADNIKASRAASMAKVVALLREHKADLGSYITSDPKGQHIPAFLEQLSLDWLAQQQTLIKELESLRANIDHIKEIVAMQQSYTKVSGVTEIIKVSDLVEDSLRMNDGALVRHPVQVIREFEEVPPISVEKHKVLQILVNLVRNAKQACDEVENSDPRITLRIAQADDRIRISVSDNGTGIAAENLIRIFAHGFTTRKDGHGFGLHSGALAAVELGGSLSAHSEGLGKGATFTLELPLQSAGVRV